MVTERWRTLAMSRIQVAGFIHFMGVENPWDNIFMYSSSLYKQSHKYCWCGHDNLWKTSTSLEVIRTTHVATILLLDQKSLIQWCCVCCVCSYYTETTPNWNDYDLAITWSYITMVTDFFFLHYWDLCRVQDFIIQLKRTRLVATI